MKNRKKQQVASWLIIIALVASGVFVYFHGNKITTPQVNQSGKISGDYSIADIMSLGLPYECTFSKSDGDYKVSGIMQMTKDKLRGNFDITIPMGNINGKNSQNTNFTSHFIMINDITYTWTSLQSIGYRSPVAKSAKNNASPQEQAQIMGTRDKTDYICNPWNENLSVFELPSNITFLDLK